MLLCGVQSYQSHIFSKISRNGAAVAPSCKDGNLVSDDGKPRDKVSDTVRNMAAGEPARKFVVGQQVFLDFLR